MFELFKQLALEYLDLWRQFLNMLYEVFPSNEIKATISNELELLDDVYDKLLDGFSWDEFAKMDKQLSKFIHYIYEHKEDLAKSKSKHKFSDARYTGEELYRLRMIMAALARLVDDFFTCSPHKCSHIQILTQ